MRLRPMSHYPVTIATRNIRWSLWRTLLGL